jgi:ribosome-binding protein aMBF1 (putative translation factor)
LGFLNTPQDNACSQGQMPLLLQAEYQVRYREFLSRLREARRQAGLTQAEVAERLGKPQSFVSKCESGERRVDFVEVLAFSRLYHVSLEYFYDPPNDAQ